jgi:hypothetical protein
VANSTSIAADMRPFSVDPITFSFDVTTAGQVREIIFREDDVGTVSDPGDQNRARLNGFTLQTLVPIELTLEVNTTTGAMQILNEQGVTFDMSYYEIRSSAGSLNPGGWSSLDDDEGSDPVGTGWDESPHVSTDILSEVNLTSLKTFATSGPGSMESLGSAFTPSAAQDLSFHYSGPSDTFLRQGIVKYVTSGGVMGDYNGNGIVDAADYTVWRDTLGAAVPNGTGADGDNDGIVDEGDYTVWKANFGSGGTGTGAVSAVPEPASAGLLTLAWLLLCTQVRRRRRLERHPV